MKTIACVLKSGGDFGPEYVEWLRRQCAEKMPDWQFRCWSDMGVDGAIPLTRGWRGWWSKFEIHGTDFDGPALMVDLDTVFLDELKILPEHEDRAIFLRDPWHDGSRNPERLASGVSYLPKWARDQLWREFSANPDAIMDKYHGDDQVVNALFFDAALRWQDHYLDELVSYKAYVRGIGIQPENKVVYFHGIPRPWQCNESWIPKISSIAGQPSQECLI